MSINNLKFANISLLITLNAPIYSDGNITSYSVYFIQKNDVFIESSLSTFSMRNGEETMALDGA